MQISLITTLLFATALTLQGQSDGSSSAVIPEDGKTQARGTHHDWPMFQGPRGDGSTPETGWLEGWPEDDEPRVAWRAKLGLGLASFAVVDSRIYSAGNDGKDKDTLWCLDLDTGEVLWKHEMAVPTKCHEMPIVPYGPAATPAVVDGTVYHLSRAGHLLALDAVTGEKRWERHFVDDFGGATPVYGYSSSPAIYGDRLFLDVGQEEPGTNKGSTVCLNRRDGSILWQAGEGQAGYATPIVRKIQGQELLVLFKGEALELSNPKTGELRARHATTTRDFCNAATPTVFNNDTIVLSHTGKAGTRGMRWDGTALTEAWSIPGHGLLFHSGIPFDGMLVAFNDESRNSNNLQLIHPKSGGVVWDSDALPKGNAIISDDGTALILGRTGELVAAKLSSKGVEIVHRMQVLGGKSYIQPVLAGRRVLCRNNKGDTVCLDLR